MRYVLRPQLWVPILSAVDAGAAMFAVGYAANDDGGSAAPATPRATNGAEPGRSVANVPISAGVPRGAVPATGGKGGHDGAGRSLARGEPYGPYGGGCPAPLDGVLTGGKLDPGLGGLQPKFLTGDFTLSAFSVSATTNCYETDAPPRTFRSVNTTWIHTPSGMSVGILETDGADRAANAMWEGGGNFWSNGRSYNVWVGVPVIMTVDEATGMPPPPDLAAMQALAWAVVKQIAPELEERCFNRQQIVDWSKLASLGIGDPRPAIPAGLTLQQMNAWRFIPADPSCGNPALDGGYTTANANAMWAGGEGEYLHVNASGYSEAAMSKFPAETGQWGEGNGYWMHEGSSSTSIGCRAR